MRLRAAWFVVVLGLLAGSADAAPILIVSGGILQGATGVVVGSNTYDVSFVDGTCVSLFNGCDQVTDFTFQTSGDAAGAAQALLDGVFLDGPAGAFDSQPFSTRGCAVNVLNTCGALVPYTTGGGVVGAQAARNTVSAAGDAPTVASTTITNDLVAAIDATWAVFTPAATPVPEPATLVLLGSGLVAAGVRRRLRKRA